MILNTKAHGDVDLDTATRTTLAFVRAGLEADLQEINFTIEETKRKRFAPDWVRRVRGARKAVLKRLSYVNAAISSTPKERKPPSDKGRRVADLFVDVARVRLQEEVFKGILEDAIERWNQATLDPSTPGVLF